MPNNSKKGDPNKPAYPTQPTAPAAQSVVHHPTAYGYPTAVDTGIVPGAPPSYSQAMSHPVVPNSAPYTPWGQPGQMPQYGAPQYGAPYHYGQVPPQMNPMYGPGPYLQPSHPPVVQPPATFVNAFDAGARFDSTSQARIPPPPPGIAPNVAQVAHANGHHVVAGQRPGNFLSGGSDGGYTFW